MVNINVKKLISGLNSLTELTLADIETRLQDGEYTPKELNDLLKTLLLYHTNPNLMQAKDPDQPATLISRLGIPSSQQPTITYNLSPEEVLVNSNNDAL